MLVPTNSTLMQFLAGPSDHSTRSQVSSILHPGDDPLIGFHPFAFLVHHSDDRLNHKFRHGLISGGCVDSKPTQQRLRKAERYILMSSDLHRSKCITEICDPAESETKAQLELKRAAIIQCICNLTEAGRGQIHSRLGDFLSERCRATANTSGKPF